MIVSVLWAVPQAAASHQAQTSCDSMFSAPSVPAVSPKQCHTQVHDDITV